MSTSVTSPVTVSDPTFTGVSKFASSLQQVLSRAESIASLPLQSMEADLTTLQSQQSALQSMDTTFSTLQDSLGDLQTAIGAPLTASSSDSSVVTATVQQTASAGTYTIDVGSLGAYSTALSVAGSTAVSTPSSQGISSSTSYTLNVNGVKTTITAASSSLQDLVSAINSQASGQVQATIINVGSTSSPDYRLSLQAANLGDLPLGLTDSGGSNLISSSAGGALASYTLNGQPTPITSSSRTVTLAPGLTVSLVGQSTSGQAATVTVSNDPSGIASAFSSFATDYNAAVDAITAQHGQSAGALQGDSLLDELTGILNQLGTYSNGTPESALANFGITLDESGHLSVDTSTFDSAANADFSGLMSMLGTATSGGFMETATNLLNGVEDSTTGAIKLEENSLTTQITDQQNKITDEQNSLNQLESNLTQQISQADTTIANLESQVTYVTGLFAQYTGANNNPANGLQTL